MNTNEKKWSDTAWEKAAPIYQAILKMPFISSLTDGTLPREAFERYILQDSLYIGRYSRVLAHIASRLPSESMTEAFLSFAQDGVAVERGLHSKYLSAGTGKMSPACRFYTAVLESQGSGPVEIEAAAVLPCFRVYLEAGKVIAAHSAPDNPYCDWISVYSDPAFGLSTAKAVDICDELAASASPDIRRQMTEIYVECTRLEWLFWHSAYEDLEWQI